MPKLTDKIVRGLAGPSDGKPYVIHYDGRDGIRGFGVRVTKGGAKSWILNYRARGIERRMTLGSFPDWSATQAREQAKSLKRRVDMGEDPQLARHEERHAPTISDLCDTYIQQHLYGKRPQSQREDKSMIAQWLLPAFGRKRVADLRLADIEKLHKEASATAPVRANRLVALLSTMLNLAVRAEIITANPAKGLRKNPEHGRERYLSGDELARLMMVLAGYPDQLVSDAIRLLLLTGARRGEVLGMQWSQLDSDCRVWTKPAGFVKQKRSHRVPLSDAARAILVRIKEAHVDVNSPFVFACLTTKSGHLSNLHHQWAAIRQAAGLSDVRIHDLRHSYASFLASAGLSLPIIGALLGHHQPSTTARYSHLLDAPLRAATELVGGIVSPHGGNGSVGPFAPEATVVEIGAAVSDGQNGGADEADKPAAEVIPLKEREETQKASLGFAQALRDAAMGVAGVRESLGLPPLKLTPALRKMLTFIAEAGAEGRMLLQVTVSGGRASSQFQALKNAGYVADAHAPVDQPDRVVATAAGRAALAPPRSTAMMNAFAGIRGNGSDGPAGEMVDIGAARR